MSDLQTYCGNNHRIAPGIHLAIGNPLVILRDGEKEWHVEWHYYHGPSAMTKTGDPCKRQPGERSRFWIVAQWWHDQGAKVVDGVGQWEEPPIVEVRGRREGLKLIADPNGDLVIGKCYAGYEKWMFRF